MINIYTIGFTKKSAEEFFALLDSNDVKVLYDIRLNNSSQLAGFTKGSDLEFFLRKILSIEYIHDIKFSPTKEILSNYKNKVISWEEYEKRFNMLLKERKLEKYIYGELLDKLDGICFLCSEDKADFCHRRLVAEYIKTVLGELQINITHL